MVLTVLIVFFTRQCKANVHHPRPADCAGQSSTYTGRHPLSVRGATRRGCNIKTTPFERQASTREGGYPKIRVRWLPQLQRSPEGDLLIWVKHLAALTGGLPPHLLAGGKPTPKRQDGRHSLDALLQRPSWGYAHYTYGSIPACHPSAGVQGDCLERYTKCGIAPLTVHTGRKNLLVLVLGTSRLQVR